MLNRTDLYWDNKAQTRGNVYQARCSGGGKKGENPPWTPLPPSGKTCRLYPSLWGKRQIHKALETTLNKLRIELIIVLPKIGKKKD